MPADVAIARHFDVDELFSAEELGSLQPAAPLPLYHQLYGILKAHILSGRPACGDVLPGEAKMADAWQVSRITVQKALRMLTAEKLIRRQRGIGSYVVYRKARGTAAGSDAGDPDRDDKNAVAAGCPRVLERQWVNPADSPLTIACDTRSRCALLYVCSLTAQTPQSPATLRESWVLPFGGNAADRDLARQSSMAQLHGLGPAAERTQRSVSVEPASDRAIKLLGLLPGNPLMTVSDLYFDAKGTPVGLVECRYNPLGFRFDLGTRSETEAMSAMSITAASPKLRRNDSATDMLR